MYYVLSTIYYILYAICYIPFTIRYFTIYFYYSLYTILYDTVFLVLTNYYILYTILYSLGDGFLQLGDWRLGTADLVHFSFSHRKGNTVQIVRRDGITASLGSCSRDSF